MKNKLILLWCMTTWFNVQATDSVPWYHKCYEYFDIYDTCIRKRSYKSCVEERDYISKEHPVYETCRDIIANCNDRLKEYRSCRCDYHCPEDFLSMILKGSCPDYCHGKKSI